MLYDTEPTIKVSHQSYLPQLFRLYMTTIGCRLPMTMDNSAALSCENSKHRRWFYKVTPLICTIVLISIINQKHRNYVGSKGIARYYTLNLCCLTSLLWQLQYMRKNKNPRLSPATSLPFKSEDRFPRGYVPQLTTVTALQVRWSSMW
jgi:hypothetical protein